MQMRIQHIEPHPQLKGYVMKLWVFESSGRMPSEDMKLIVPNGMVKLTIPFRNGLFGKNNESSLLSKESKITLIGICDVPAIVDIELDAPSGSIGIEFSPVGAYRIFRLPQAELKNKILPFEDVLGKSAKAIEEIIANTENISHKVRLIQAYLIKLLQQTEPDPILDYCIDQIQNTNGLIRVGELERKTGYSSRWLYEKFIEKVGLSAKNLSAVARFMQFYENWAKDPQKQFYRQDIYDYFYDQAHFSKEFKRFTGLPPSKFSPGGNEFGRIFYKD
jgi:AraC-like DNA-binding protein